MANVDAARIRLAAFQLKFACTNQIAVFAGNADRLALIFIQQRDDFFIHKTAQYHLDHVHGLAVGHAHAVDKIRFDIELGKQFAYLRAAAVYDDGINAHQFH